MSSDDEDDCDHKLEVFEQDADGTPTVRCRCGRVVEHMLIDGDEEALQEADTDRDDLADTEPSPDSWPKDEA